MDSPFISDFLYLKEIPEINGWGVFTKKSIQEDTVIEVSPIFLYPQSLLSIAVFMASAEGVQHSEIGIDQYSIYWPDAKESRHERSAIMLGYLSMYNHSTSNNAKFFSDFKQRLMGIVTIKPIAEGEQITVSYSPTWFEQKKGYIKYVDF
jgi:SET domain-containing protein